MYKILISDLDDSLLNDQKHVSKADIETIKQFTDTKFVVATGRSFDAIQDILSEIGLSNKKGQYCICYNGALIYENSSKTPIFSQFMTFEEANKIFEIGKQYDVCINICAEDYRYVYNPTENDLMVLNRNHARYKIIGDNISSLKNINITKIIYEKNDMDYLRKIRQEIKQDDNFSISYSSNMIMEINHLNVSKGNGLLKLCELLNIDINDTIAMGDSLNDLSMIKTAHIGIGVKNSSEDIIPYCDEILDVTNNEDPVTHIYNKYIK